MHFSDQQGVGLPLNGSCHIHSLSSDNLHQRFSSFYNFSAFAPSSSAAAGQDSKIPPPPPPLNGRAPPPMVDSPLFEGATEILDHNDRSNMICPEVSKALSGVLLIAEQKKRNEEATKVWYLSYLVTNK